MCEIISLIQALVFYNLFLRLASDISTLTANMKGLLDYFRILFLIYIFLLFLFSNSFLYPNFLIHARSLVDGPHVARERAGAIRAQSSMASALLKGKQIIPWKIITLRNLLRRKDMSLDFLPYMMGIWETVYLPIYKRTYFLIS